jgi:Rad3-related DNA helicase
LQLKGLEPEVRAAALLLQEALDAPAWFYKAGMTDDGGLALHHKMPGRLLKRTANLSHVAFISATLTIGDRFDDFKRAMGIAKTSDLSCAIEPAHHGKLEFEVADVEVNSPEWLALVQSTITQRQALGPVLVVTPSHELAELLGNALPQATVRRQDETASQAAARMGNSPVLIAAGAWAGLDTPTAWATVVVPRIPYERPVVLDGEVESSFLDTRNTAVRRMRQVAGRGLRSPNAMCKLYVLDGRYGNIAAFVPQRFQGAWQSRGFLEGRRVELTLSKVERDPTVRRKALSHYGMQCMACGFEPKSTNQLDVHHLNPVAQGGERLTGLADVAVLCANCHRLAHSQQPPLAIEALKMLL